MIGTISMLHAAAPPVSSHVRGQIMMSGFFVIPSKDGCMVYLVAHIDLGGSLPSSIINMLSYSAPVKTLNKVKAILKPK